MYRVGERILLLSHNYKRAVIPQNFIKLSCAFFQK